METRQFNRENAYEKLDILKKILKELGKIAVAYSSGADSTFLLKVSHEMLKNEALAITVHSHSFPQRELEEAFDFCTREGIHQIVCEFDELAVKGFSQNPPNRCYLCKKALFEKIQETACENGILHVAEGSNTDDERDYRPGMKAIAELGILSPLRKAGLTKEEIRFLSREYGLPTWDKPSFACLSSRFAYGETITREKLQMVEEAEQFLWNMGFSQVRVRVHGSLARIEIPAGEFTRLLSEKNSTKITSYLKNIGFSYITMDLNGYRMGSMNESLDI
ncbi:ATP-dependent sacrificial sulfur transferase LarE [Lachnospiraceae bacterium 45-W7]